jgi:putative transposase
LVFATKYRRKVFATDKDHIHLLVSIAPRMAISDAVRILKSNTARMMVKKFPFIKQVYDGEMNLWSIGYFVSTVGANEKTIQAYIEHQGLEDSGQAQLELG